MLLVIGNPGSTWVSQRDHLLLGMLYNTEARVSEIVGVHVADVVLDAAACVYLHGKGRKPNHHPSLRGSRPCHEGSGTGQTSGARHQYLPLPRPRLIA
jgi:site-specific recombinase XerC